MPDLRTPSFNLELPDGVVDQTVYSFVFPELGDLPPSLVLRITPASDDADPASSLQSLAESLRDARPAAILSEVRSGRHGDWPYALLRLDWGAANERMREKHVHVLMAGENRQLASLTVVDRAANSARSERILNAVIRSLELV